jgi:non-specific serine/threonine protein kinase
LRIDATFGAGQLARHQGDARRARELAEAVLAEPEAASDPLARALALFLLGNVRGDLGDHAREEELYQEALALFLDHGEDDWAGRTLGKLGAVAQLRGDVAGLERYSEEKLRLHRASGNGWGAADALSNLAEVALLRGDTHRALALRREALDRYVAVGNRLGILDTLRGIATIAAASHQPTLAARLFGAEDALRRVDGVVLAAELQTRHTSCLSAVRTAMGRAAFAAAWDVGAGLSLDLAIAEARALDPPTSPDAEPAEDAVARLGLTRREVEVLALLVSGKSNPAIGEALFISPRTAQTHVTSILAKLGVATRAEAAAVAVRDGLI